MRDHAPDLTILTDRDCLVTFAAMVLCFDNRVRGPWKRRAWPAQAPAASHAEPTPAPSHRRGRTTNKSLPSHDSPPSTQTPAIAGAGVCSHGCWSPGGMVACRTVPRRPVAAARPAASIRLSSERLWCGRGSCHDRGCRYIRCFVVVAKPAARRAGTWDVTLLWQGLVLMNRRQVGLTGLSVNELGFGGAAIGGLFKPSSADVARAAVDAAWDAGIRYFDTAPHYGLGMSERRLGEALRGRPREEYVLSTKVSRLLAANPAPTGSDLGAGGFAVPDDLVRVLDYSADGVRRSLDASLLRLGLDRVDIVLVHDPDDHADQAGTGARPGRGPGGGRGGRA